MARLVKDVSDDEFPDVDELLRGSKSKTTSGTTSKSQNTTNGTTRKGTSSKNATISAKTENFAIVTEVKELERNESSDAENAKPKPRKRVLKQPVDNPLLKPLGASKITSSSGSKRVLDSKPRVQKATAAEAPQRIERKPVERNVPSLKIVPKESREPQSDEEVEENESNNSKPPRRNFPIAKPRSKATRRPATPSSKEETEEDESDDMSDFIVDDDEEDDDNEEDSDIFTTPPKATPPRSTRKLVRGRRPRVESSDSEEDTLRDLLEKTTIKDYALPDPKPQKKNDIRPGTSSSIEDQGAILQFIPSPRKVSKEVRVKTPPRSPELKPRGLASPKKLPRIPSTPHRPSMDLFWSQDAVNDWNDQYSPIKALQPIPKAKLPASSTSGGGLFSPKKSSPIKTDRLTKDAKKAFSTIKHDLATSFLLELDTKITSGQIAQLSASTGGVQIIWSNKLNTTAGRANWKRETIKNPTGPPIHRHYASIELAEKVIDDSHRLLNVLAHEFCHLANFMVSNIKTNPHGKEFKAWAAKCSAEFGARGIEVTTKHSYEIDYKYVWECVEEGCGALFKRHSKSIDVVRHRCGTCKGKLAQIKPVPRGAAGGAGKESEYQVFFRENMKKIKEENPGTPQKEVMALVGKRYQEFKARKAEMEGREKKDVGQKETVPDERDGDGVMEAVSRKLDFLDLTSP